MWEPSQTARVLKGINVMLTRAREGSVLITSVEKPVIRAKSVIHLSYCYRWLTAEPDPEIIVIDLQKTHTVGPFIGLLERAVEPIERALADSKSASITAAVGESVSDSRIGRVLAALLEPPEPPVDSDEKIK